MFLEDSRSFPVVMINCSTEHQNDHCGCECLNSLISLIFFRHSSSKMQLTSKAPLLCLEMQAKELFKHRKCLAHFEIFL